MAKYRHPYLLKEKNRHSAIVWYVRLNKESPRFRVRGTYGTEEFAANYREAFAAATGALPAQPPKKPKAGHGSLSWLIDRYKDSGAWAILSLATKRQRENILDRIAASSGELRAAEIGKAEIRETLEAKKETPFAANNFLKTMRGLFRWAVAAEHITVDPTVGVTGTTPTTTGFHPWSEEEIDLFEAHWAIGTRERLALAVLLYTGLRRGDAARLGRQHVKKIPRKVADKIVTISVITLRTEKTGTQVVIPILPELAAAIAATKTGDLAFIAKANGEPMKKEAFGNWFRNACRAAGVPGSAHGLRKAGATRAANRGASERQLNAIFGWAEGSKQSADYTRTADRERLARDAIGLLGEEGSGNDPIPAPETGAGNIKVSN